MCGIVGLVQQRPYASVEIYEALLMLQHRGQDAAGMVTSDGRLFRERKGAGMVKDVFTASHINELTGSLGLGHVRYPTAGTLSVQEAQPFFVNAPYGIYLVHNGNLVHTDKLRQKMQTEYRRYLRTESDSEVLLNVLANSIYRAHKENPENSVVDNILDGVTHTMKQVQGAYSVICLIDGVGMLAFRDPFGIRPLSYGQRLSPNGASEWMVASEDVAFRSGDFAKVGDVGAGEAILVQIDGKIIRRQCQPSQITPCLFEYIYLARPDSMLDNISVYKTQLRLGQSLAKQIREANLEIDTVMPVPDSARPAALEIAQTLGIKYREGLVKNRYVGRTFIMPQQQQREHSVRRKLNPIPLEFRERSVLLVDDSIVRGTTMKQIVELCRQAGAKKVYVASAAPPIRHPNVYGIDMPTAKELIAADLTIPEVQKLLGCDALFFQTLPEAVAAAQAGNPKIKQFECSCFDGNYITGDITPEYLQQLAEQREQGRPLETLNPTLI